MVHCFTDEQTVCEGGDGLSVLGLLSNRSGLKAGEQDGYICWLVGEEVYCSLYIRKM